MPTAETALQPATTTANNRPKTPRQGIMASSPEITQPTRPGGAQCPKTYFNVPGRMRFPRQNDFHMVADVQAIARHARNTTSAQKARLARKRPPRSCEAEHVVTFPILHRGASIATVNVPRSMPPCRSGAPRRNNDVAACRVRLLRRMKKFFVAVVMFTQRCIGWPHIPLRERDTALTMRIANDRLGSA